MGSKGGSILLLLVLAVLCHSGGSLTCYTCVDNKACNKTTVCSVNFDTCLWVKAEPEVFQHQCWKFDDCNYNYISKTLGLRKLEYHCCQQDLCNRDAAASISGKTALLLVPLLAAVWTLCL
ncbi:CD59 glycoprotein [Ailuropoda melanoleuca]|uniref:MAC-inhibitory protein n=2 Tax=Ailuropoda melanoleuca TaxID=9646 RepID=G1LL89_AILME|nr:CD59 glycoprotein [Ailuropoda melanoleuca]XP_019653363.1 CD59 glycoprotein [Ailuropoda melanoleuca]XP_019653365.1 CD59 glycoprotein [Ailuropoda melanoleuca]XP_034501385.1 CD59 glycoprotein [Ailuropoda melanoleuca]